MFSASCQISYLTVMILSKLLRPCNAALLQSFFFCITRADISIVFHLIKRNNLIFALTGTVFAVRPHTHGFIIFRSFQGKDICSSPFEVPGSG